MIFEKTINIAVGCVMASHMKNKDKRETIDKLREIEELLEEKLIADLGKTKFECVACNGSGWYDSCDEEGNPIPCGACDGTGKED